MAGEMRRIADQLDRAVNGPAWHGQSILELLRGVTARDATARPIPDAHSIWELVAHTAAWLEIARLRLEGTAPRRITQSMNWPPVNAKRASKGSASQAWKTDVNRLRRAARDLHAAIGAQDDGRLDEELPGVDDTWSAYITLHGVLQHVLYHAGQIAILKKGTP
ncbi:MAG TPA: DinB family protein [Vicinamibacterales bacterium]|nr:DinB family protein [Vicinamibacterales bacterium]